MRVVSNTSPISNLAIIGLLEVLRRQLGEIHIPPAVCAELLRLENGNARKAIEDSVSDGWIRMVELSNQSTSRALQESLDPGESEAIALAVEARAELLVMDESAGRAAARAQGIRVTGTLGILLRERKAGGIASIGEEMERLVREAGFYVSAHVGEQFLREAGEV